VRCSEEKIQKDSGIFWNIFLTKATIFRNLMISKEFQVEYRLINKLQYF